MRPANLFEQGIRQSKVVEVLGATPSPSTDLRQVGRLLLFLPLPVASNSSGAFRRPVLQCGHTIIGFGTSIRDSTSRPQGVISR